MTPKSILVISTYPIRKPQHGGQKRTAAIVEAYSRKFRNVKSCAVFFKGFYSDHGPDDIPIGRLSEEEIRRSPLTDDIICGAAIYQDPTVKARFIELLNTFKPDIIHVEQPATYLGLRLVLDELRIIPKIIFGSQNIEAPMKREILERAGVPSDEALRVEKKIAELERDVTQKSDLVAACTSQDLEAHRKLGAKKLVLAPNGIAKSYTNHQELKHWQTAFQKSAVSRTVLYVGSGHPPNWTGFLQMVGKGLGFLPADTRLVVAGSVCVYFDQEIKPGNLTIEDATFWLRAISAGRVSEESLGALIRLSDIMLLPITEGGGSNLKTAEAILADKKVVTTSHGLRSFEWFHEFPNVWVADTKAEFQRAIVAALEAPFITRTDEQTRLARQVEWEHCLKPLVEEAVKL